MSYKTLLLTPDNAIAPLPAGPEEAQAGSRFVSVTPDNEVVMASSAGQFRLVGAADIGTALNMGGKVVLMDDKNPDAVKMWAPDDTLRAITMDKVPQALLEGGRFYDGTPLANMPKPKNASVTDARVQEANFRAANPDWIGPKPTKPIDQIENGAMFLNLQAANTRGKAGFGEEFFNIGAKDIPFIGDVVGAAISMDKLRTLPDVVKRMQDGQPVTDDELVDLNAYMADSKRHADASASGQWGRGIRENLVFGTEFFASSVVDAAIGGATTLETGPGALIGAGVGAVAGGSAALAKRALVKVVSKEMASAVEKGLASAAGKYAAKFGGLAIPEAVMGKVVDVTEKGTSKVIGQKVVGGVANALGQGTAITLENLGLEAAANIAQGQPILAGKGATDREISMAMMGQEIDPEKARYMELGDKAINYYTEFSGDILGAFASDIVGKPIRKLAGETGAALASREWGTRLKELYDNLGAGAALPESLKGFAGQTVEQVQAGAATAIGKTKAIAGLGLLAAKTAVKYGVDASAAIDILKKSGYHGILEEMGEERLGGFLSGLFGVSGDSAGLSNALDQMIPTLDQAKQEIVLFSTPIIGVTAIAMAENSKALGGQGWDAWVRKANTIRDSLKPVTGVHAEVVNDTGTQPPVTPVTSANAAAAASPRVSADDLTDLIAEDQQATMNQPTGFMGRVLRGVLGISRAVVSGSPAALMHTSVDNMLADESGFALGRYYRAVYGSTLQRATDDLTRQAAEKGAIPTEADQTKIADEAKQRALDAAHQATLEQVTRYRETIAVDARSFPKGKSPEETRQLLEKAVEAGRLVKMNDPHLGVYYVNVGSKAFDLSKQLNDSLGTMGIISNAHDLDHGPTDNESFAPIQMTSDQLKAVTDDPTHPDNLRFIHMMGLHPTTPAEFEEARKTANIRLKTLTVATAMGRILPGDVVTGPAGPAGASQDFLVRANADRPNTFDLMQGDQPFATQLTQDQILTDRGLTKKQNTVVSFTPFNEVHGTAAQLVQLPMLRGYISFWAATRKENRPQGTQDAIGNEWEFALANATPEQKKGLLQDATVALRSIGVGTTSIERADKTPVLALSLGATNWVDSSSGTGYVTVSLRGDPYHFIEDTQEVFRKKYQQDGLSEGENLWLNNIRAFAQRAAITSRIGSPERTAYEKLFSELGDTAQRDEYINKIFNRSVLGWDLPSKQKLIDLAAQYDLTALPGFDEVAAMQEQIFGMKLADIKAQFSNMRGVPAKSKLQMSGSVKAEDKAKPAAEAPAKVGEAAAAPEEVLTEATPTEPATATPAAPPVVSKPKVRKPIRKQRKSKAEAAAEAEAASGGYTENLSESEGEFREAPEDLGRIEGDEPGPTPVVDTPAVEDATAAVPAVEPVVPPAVKTERKAASMSDINTLLAGLDVQAGPDKVSDGSIGSTQRPGETASVAQWKEARSAIVSRAVKTYLPGDDGQTWLKTQDAFVKNVLMKYIKHAGVKPSQEQVADLMTAVNEVIDSKHLAAQEELDMQGREAPDPEEYVISPEEMALSRADMLTDAEGLHYSSDDITSRFEEAARNAVTSENANAVWTAGGITPDDASDAIEGEVEKVAKALDEVSDDFLESGTPSEIAMTTVGKWNKAMRMFRGYLKILDRMYAQKGESLRLLYALSHSAAWMERLRNRDTGALHSVETFQKYIEDKSLTETDASGAVKRRVSREEVAIKAMFRRLADRGVPHINLLWGMKALSAVMSHQQAITARTAVITTKDGTTKVELMEDNKYDASIEIVKLATSRVRSYDQNDWSRIRAEYEKATTREALVPFLSNLLGISPAVLNNAVFKQGERTFYGPEAIDMIFRQRLDFQFKTGKYSHHVGFFSADALSREMAPKTIRGLADNLIGSLLTDSKLRADPGIKIARGADILSAASPLARSRAPVYRGADGSQYAGWLSESDALTTTTTLGRKLVAALVPSWKPRNEDIIEVISGVNRRGQNRKALAWEKLGTADRDRVRLEMFKSGSIFMGVFGDKNAAAFMRISQPGPPLTRSQLLTSLRSLVSGVPGLGLSGYKAMYEASQQAVKDVLVSPADIQARIDELAKNPAGPVEDAYDVAINLYRDIMYRALNGNYDQYVKKGKFDEPTLIKRRASDWTPGMPTLTGFKEKFGRDPRVLILNDFGPKVVGKDGTPRVLSKILDGEFLFSEDFGIKIRELLGPLLARNNELSVESPDFDKLPSVKGLLKWTINPLSRRTDSFGADEGENQTLLGKFNGINLDLLADTLLQSSYSQTPEERAQIRAALDPFFTNLRDLVQSTGADMIWFKDTSVKVSGPVFSGKSVDVFNNVGERISGNSAGAAAGSVFEVPGEKLRIPNSLLADPKAKMKREPVQLLTNLTFLSTAPLIAELDNQSRGLRDESLQMDDPDWLYNNVVRPNLEDEFMRDFVASVVPPEGKTEPNVELTNPINHRILAEAKVRAAAKALEVKSPTAQLQAIGGVQVPYPAYKIDNTTGRMALPWVAATIVTTGPSRRQTYLRLDDNGIPVGFATKEDAMKYVLDEVNAVWDKIRDPATPAAEAQAMLTTMPFLDLFTSVTELEGRTDITKNVLFSPMADGKEAHTPFGSPDLRLGADGRILPNTMMIEDIRNDVSYRNTENKDVVVVPGWVIGGTPARLTRVPAEGLPSSTIHRLMTDFPRRANFVMVPIESAEAKGGDKDGDAEFVSVLASNEWDGNTKRAFVNRRLMLQVMGYKDINIAYVEGQRPVMWSQVPVTDIMELYQDIAKELRATVDATQRPKLNTREFDSMIEGVAAAGKALLGIAAKSKSGHVFGNLFGATTKSPFKVSVNGESYDVGRSKKEMADMLSGSKQLAFMLDHALAGYIGMSADDIKSLLMGYTGLNRTTLPWMIAFLSNLKEMSYPVNGSFDYRREMDRIRRVTTNFMTALVNDPFLKQLQAEFDKRSSIFGTDDEASKEAIWRRLAWERAPDELKATALAADFSGLKYTTKNPQTNAVNWILQKSDSVMAQWYGLKELAGDEFKLGMVLDMQTQAKPPTTMGEYLRLKEAFDEVMGNKLAHLDTSGFKDSPYAAGARAAMARYSEAYNGTWMGSTVAMAIVRSKEASKFGKFLNDADTLDSMYNRMERVMTANAMARLAPFTPIAPMTLPTFRALEKKYGADNAFLRLLGVELGIKDKSVDKIALREAYRRTELMDATVASARAAFDSMERADQLALLGNQLGYFGTSEATHFGSYKKFMGDPATSAFRHDLALEIEKEAAIWDSGEGTAGLGANHDDALSFIIFGRTREEKRGFEGEVTAYGTPYNEYFPAAGTKGLKPAAKVAPKVEVKPEVKPAPAVTQVTPVAPAPVAPTASVASVIESRLKNQYGMTSNILRDVSNVWKAYFGDAETIITKEDNSMAIHEAANDLSELTGLTKFHAENMLYAASGLPAELPARPYHRANAAEVFNSMGFMERTGDDNLKYDAVMASTQYELTKAGRPELAEAVRAMAHGTPATLLESPESWHRINMPLDGTNQNIAGQAYYDANNHSMEFFAQSAQSRPELARTVAHELAHAFTWLRHSNDKEFADRVTELLTHVRDPKHGPAFAMTDAIEYGLSNEREFIAMAYESTEFQKFLLMRRAPEGWQLPATATGWDAFLKIVADTFRAFLGTGFGDRFKGSSLEALFREVATIPAVAATEEEPATGMTASIADSTSIPDAINRVVYRKAMQTMRNYRLPEENDPKFANAKKNFNAALGRRLAEIRKSWDGALNRLFSGAKTFEDVRDAADKMASVRGRTFDFNAADRDSLVNVAYKLMPLDESTQAALDIMMADDSGSMVQPELPLFQMSPSVASYREFIDAFMPLPSDGRNKAQEILRSEAAWLRGHMGEGASRYAYDQKHDGLFDDDGRLRPMIATELPVDPFDKTKGTTKLFRFGRRLFQKATAENTLTPAEQSEVQLYRWAAGAAMENSPIVLGNQFDPNDPITQDGVVVPKAIVDEFKALLLAENGLAKARTLGYLIDYRPAGATDPIESTWVIPVARYIQHWNQSSAKAKLIANGRQASNLDIMALAERKREDFNNDFNETELHMRGSMGDDALQLWYRSSYLPHAGKGVGFYGAKEKEVLYRLNKELAAAKVDVSAKYDDVLDAGMKSGNDTPTDRMLRTLYRLRNVPAPATGVSHLADLRAGGKEAWGMYPDMTYADIAVGIRDTTLRFLQARIIRGLPLDAEINGMANPLSKVAALNKQIAGFTKREFSGRLERRHYENFVQAYEQAGLLPKTMDPIQAHHQYQSDLLVNLINKATLTQMAQQTDEHGKLLYVVDPNAEYDGRQSMFTDAFWDDHYTTLARQYKFSGDFNKTAKENLRALVQLHIDKKGDYELVKSNYPSVDRFYAIKDTTDRANIMDAFVGGQAAGVLKHLVELPADPRWGNIRWLNAISHANAWMKTNALGLSVFFAKSALESLVAARGPKFYRPSEFKQLYTYWQMIQSGHPYMKSFIHDLETSGVEISRTLQNDMGIGFVQNDVKKFADWVGQNQGVAAGRKAARFLQLATSSQGQFMFEDLFNTAKIYLAMKMSHDAQTKAEAAGEKFDRPAYLQKWSKMIDDSLGGQDWNRYSYMTPRMNQFFNLSLFSWNWSISAANVAGMGLLTSRVLKNYVRPHELKFISTNWVWMISMVLLAEPAVIQAITWAVSPKKPDDEPFVWNNEEGKKTYADITPLMRMMPSYEGAPTGSRRIYLRYGKQAYEVLEGWFGHPLTQLMTKMSQPARLAFELATGRSPGNEWELGFKNEGLKGLIQDRDGEFSGSMLGTVFQKFVPFSILSWASNPDARPASLIGPTSKGMSFGKAINAFEGLLRTYANDDTWHKLKKSPTMQHNLEALAPEILDAAQRNGYDTGRIISSARGAVLKDIYARFYKALNAGDQDGMTRAGNSILRLNGTIESIKKSAIGRNKNYGQEAKLSDGQKKLIEESFK